MSPEFYWVAVVATIVLSASRIARLLVADKYPPAAWLRAKYDRLTVDRGDWIWLFHCGYCMSPWTTALVTIWADIVGVFDGEPVWGQVDDVFNRPLWFMVNGILAMAYLAATYMAHDGDTSGDDD